jgi:hypothetical protein
MTSDIKKQIAIQSRINLSSQQIMTHLCLDVDEEDLVLKTRDIINQRLMLRHNALRNLTAVQALLMELFNKNNWFVCYDSPEGHLRSLFCTFNLSVNDAAKLRIVDYPLYLQNKLLLHAFMHHASSQG